MKPVGYYWNKRVHNGSNGSYRIPLGIVICLLILCSCEDMLDVDPPDSKVPSELVFSNDDVATGVIAGLYLDLYSAASFAGGGESSIMTLAGLSADELDNDLGADLQFLNFEDNTLAAENLQVLSLWTSMYKIIYQTNAIIEGLYKPNGVTVSLRNQITGEALFVRAFCHFYLVNCFGDVPVILTTNYRINASVSRSPEDFVYDQIVSDLLQAESLMSIDYPSQDKARPNRFAATAMLARVYLYRSDWPRAEDRANLIINQSLKYNLSQNLATVFLNNSSETIWQLRQANDLAYTNEGEYFGGSRPCLLDTNLLKAFEPGDKRYLEWTTNISVDEVRPYKYRNKYSLITVGPESSVVLRLAEQYLIRAEARAQQGKLAAALSDVNSIRERAGISVIVDSENELDESDLLLLIEREKRLELFAEWGHRWFDLKRWGRADEILEPLKPNWDQEDELYPLPELEMRRNSNLRPQNPGY